MIVIAVALVAASYAIGYALAARKGRASSPVYAVTFGGALAIALAVLVGPMDGLADRSLAWHMVQHLVLTFVVAPLALLGAPVRIALAALATRPAARLARALASPAVSVLTHPVFAWVQLIAVLYVAHFSALYEGALEHPPMHALLHAVFLTSGLLFWTSILAVAPAPHAASHPVRLLVLFVTLPTSGFLGFIFYIMRTPAYAHYAAVPGALADQSNAGAVMWIAGGTPVFAALLWCVADWGARERRLGAIADRTGAT